MLPELEPGITPVTRPVLSMLAGFDCHAPPLTDQKRRTPAIPSSSWAVAVTVMLWLAGGTAGQGVGRVHAGLIQPLQVARDGRTQCGVAARLLAQRQPRARLGKHEAAVEDDHRRPGGHREDR